MNFFSQLKKHPWLGYVLVVFIIILLTNFFYLIFYTTSVADRQYTGINNYYFADKLVYRSMVQQGAEGKLMMFNLYSSEPQKGLLFSPHWWLIGQTAQLTKGDIGFVTNIYRVICTVLFFIILWFWLARLFPSIKSRSGAVILLAGAGTLGWIGLLIRQVTGQEYILAHGDWPYDVVLTDMTVFSNLQQSPLSILSHGLIIGFLYLFVSWSGRWIWRRALLWGSSLFLFLLIHPYDGLIIASIISVWCYWIWQQEKNRTHWQYWVVMMTACILAAGYFFLSWQLDPVLAGWKDQNVTITPPPGQLIVALWPYIILAAIGSVVVGRYYKNDPWWRLILIWAWIIWILAYIPDQFNRRAVNGWMIPLALLSYLGLRAIYQGATVRNLRRIVVALIFLMLVGTSLYSLYFQFHFLPESKKNEVFFISSDLSQVFTFADVAIPDRAIILSSNQKLALMIPAYTGLRSYVGHSHQTVDYYRKEQEAQQFWSDDNVVWKQEFLQKNNIDFLLMKREQFVDSNIDTWLSQVAEEQPLVMNQRYALYRVRGFAPEAVSDRAN